MYDTLKVAGEEETQQVINDALEFLDRAREGGARYISDHFGVPMLVAELASSSLGYMVEDALAWKREMRPPEALGTAYGQAHGIAGSVQVLTDMVADDYDDVGLRKLVERLAVSQLLAATIAEIQPGPWTEDEIDRIVAAYQNKFVSFTENVPVDFHGETRLGRIMRQAVQKKAA